MSKRSVLGAVSMVLGATMFGGCAVQSGADPQGENDSNEAMDAISVTRTSVVTLRPDLRRCMAPLCGGYWLHDVNSSSTTETYVSALDFAEAHLSDADVEKVRSAPLGEIVLRGKLGPAESRFHTHPLVVTEAYRGMPGVVTAPGDIFYTTTTHMVIDCIPGPCMNDTAAKVNSTVTRTFSRVNVEAAAHPFVDQDWLARRALVHGAIVAGHFVNGTHYAGGYEKVLASSQVFLRIPDTTGPCPAIKIAACPSGQVQTYMRNADRCEVPTGCVKPGICPLFLPYCGEGYTLQSIKSLPSACPKFVCDPSFVTN